MDWSFAIINGRLAEIYYNKRGRILSFIGHSYVDKSHYKSKKEKLWIEHDTQTHIFTYRNSRYYSRNPGNRYTLQVEP